MTVAQPIDTPELRKARGAFFTPDAMARFLVTWGVHRGNESILEPSCGDAVFLREAGLHLAALRGKVPERRQLVGVDLHEESVRIGETALAEAGLSASLSAGDFFDYRHEPVDVVLGNPPYVRYQDFSGPDRLAAVKAAMASGVRLSALASSWAHFTVHAASFLRPEGRMGLVLPAELLSANYAAPVRQFLLDRFTDVSLVLFTERVFPGVQEEVVLLMASGYDPSGTGADHFEIRQVDTLADLNTLASLDIPRWTPPQRSSKWTAAIGQSAAYTRLVSGETVTELGQWGRIALGAVTGRNTYFAISDAVRREWKLPVRELIRLSPPGSTHLRALTLTEGDVTALAKAGKATWLFAPGETPSAASRRYIRYGEAAEVDQAYKCRIRTPWWRVPVQQPADALITCMNADTAAICANPTGVVHLNSVHGLYLNDDHQDIPVEALALAACSTITRLGAEMVGRSYGGGLLKLEPREAAVLPVPTPAVVRAHLDELLAAVPRCRELLSTGQRSTVQNEVDRILAPSLGTDEDALDEMRVVADTLHARRRARGKKERT
ncbi:class I SAM-dependent DNA methyltransferase [Dietzia maris]|uniref:class I SAM-dependent DNA methyltransferase n=1 Tax=Dietzia maris TaxID=37915 RepID=UPI0037C9E3F9